MTVTTITRDSYTIRPWPSIRTHYAAPAPLVMDSAEDEADLLLQARARSGDYFMTLATEIEKLAESLADIKRPEAVELERIAAELIKVNQRFSIETRK